MTDFSHPLGVTIVEASIVNQRLIVYFDDDSHVILAPSQIRNMPTDELTEAGLRRWKEIMGDE